LGQEGTYSFDNVQSTPRRIAHTRTDSASSSESSNDGIEWEDEARYYDTDDGEDVDEEDGNDHSMDEDEEEYEYDYQEQDTQQLLASSSKTRKGGLGMGMRVGETGTGTTIGLDFELSRGRGYDQEYDALPLTTVDRDLSGRHDGSRNKSSSSSSSRRKGRRDRHRILHPGVPVMSSGAGDVRTEQERLLAARQVRIKMLWNIFYVFAW